MLPACLLLVVVGEVDSCALGDSVVDPSDVEPLLELLLARNVLMATRDMASVWVTGGACGTEGPTMPFLL